MLEDFSSNVKGKRTETYTILFLELKILNLSCLLKEQLLEPALNLTVHCCGLEFRVLNGYDQKSFDEERGLNCVVQTFSCFIQRAISYVVLWDFALNPVQKHEDLTLRAFSRPRRYRTMSFELLFPLVTDVDMLWEFLEGPSEKFEKSRLSKMRVLNTLRLVVEQQMVIKLTGLSRGYEQIDFALMVKEGFDIQACTAVLLIVVVVSAALLILDTDGQEH
ncbi:hypothetical protein Tco_0340861 [Tanacetum coccineum]